MHKNIRSILGNPSQQGKKPSQILRYILQEKDLHHQERPSTQEGAQTLEDWRPREVRTSPK
jgi:hypothetical protein